MRSTRTSSRPTLRWGAVGTAVTALVVDVVLVVAALVPLVSFLGTVSASTLTLVRTPFVATSLLVGVALVLAAAAVLWAATRRHLAVAVGAGMLSVVLTGAALVVPLVTTVMASVPHLGDAAAVFQELRRFAASHRP